MMRLIPDGLAGRFLLLLATALIAANVAALILLAMDRDKMDRAAIVDREIERVLSLVPALEAVPPAARMTIASDASTRFSRVSVTPVPLVGDIAARAPQAQALTRALSERLPDRDVRGAILPLGRDGRDGMHRRGGAIAISIRLGGGGGQWMNLATRNVPPGSPGFDDRMFFMLLGLSLVSTLGVSALFLRRLTRPLSHLAAATRAAGRGDRSARVPEQGARELRQVAAAFNAMQSSIARFDAERMRTMGAVGHDLRTPITSLRIRAEMLDPVDAAPMIRTLNDMTVMADGLVAFAKGSAEAEQTVTLDLSALLTRLTDERGATLTTSGPVRVRGRPVALGRALGNLIDNALRYAGSAAVAIDASAQLVTVTITDDGPGIAPDRLDAMFDPFVRGDDSRSADTGGAGLGLSIARNIILSHGGTVTLANRATGGLQVSVVLPRGATQD
ncbi:ATP-binding protein [Loktanella sp. SALINAS62]|uniref:ATP-binding protein n=1 Tax=Loktanella sp. SALINAS62 TaxID=2706124 RepID=UPI001B8CB2D0|nr:ATP-binding protein [Loktanella sp. SALINAS62]MBS1302909.1 HAMP domain-containing protein [Loktanella sp. SALINAS62]